MDNNIKPIDLFATTLVCTTVCTLKCKHCLISIHKQSNMHGDFSQIKRSLDEYFKLVNHVQEFTIMGGEAFLHPEIKQIIQLMHKFSTRIGKLFFITNGTYTLKYSTILALKSLPIDYIIHIDDYGKLSGNLNNLLSQLDKEGITYDVRHYNEEEQYYGGWVDVVGEYEFHDYPDGGQDVFNRCKNRINCKFIWDGILYGCGMHAGGAILGKVPLNSGDYIRLLDTDEPLSKKLSTLSQMGAKPYRGCNYCFGWDVDNSERIKAAEQIEY